MGNETQPVGSTQPKIYVKVIGDNVNIRDGADRQHRSIAKPKRGDVLGKTEEKIGEKIGQSDDGKWFQVETTDNKRGWIHAKLVEEQPLKVELQSQQGQQPQQPERPASPTITPPMDPATFIKKLFVKDVTDQQIGKILSDKKIEKKELENLTKSPINEELFDLIDNGMVVGSGNGKITLEEIKKFNEVLDAYTRVICDGDRNKAIELYKNAKTFEMADLKAVEDASKDVASSLGITNSSTDQQIISSFGKLTEPCKAIITTYYTILKTSGITGQALINRISLRLASLALVSQLDAASQKMILGVDVALPKYDGEITQDNISSYLQGKKLEENKTEERVAERGVSASDAKLDDPFSSDDENKTNEIIKKMDSELKGLQSLDVEKQRIKKNEVHAKYEAQISDALKSKIKLAEEETREHLLPAFQDGTGALDPAVMNLQTVRGYAHRLAAEMLFRNMISINSNKPVNLGVVKAEISSNGSLKLLKEGKQECTVTEAIKLLIEKSGTGKQVFDISVIEAIGKRLVEAQRRPASRQPDSTGTVRRKKGGTVSPDSGRGITRKPKAQQKTSAQAAKKLFGG